MIKMIKKHKIYNFFIRVYIEKLKKVGTNKNF